MKIKNFETLKQFEDTQEYSIDFETQLPITSVIEYAEAIQRVASASITPTANNTSTVQIATELKEFAVANPTIATFIKLLNSLDTDEENFEAEQTYKKILASPSYEELSKLKDLLSDNGANASSFTELNTDYFVQPSNTDSPTTTSPTPPPIKEAQPVVPQPIPTTTVKQSSPSTTPQPQQSSSTGSHSAKQPQPKTSDNTTTATLNTSALQESIDLSDIRDILNKIAENTFSGELTSKLAEIQTITQQSPLLANLLTLALDHSNQESETAYHDFVGTINTISVSQNERTLIRQAAIKLGIRTEKAANLGFEVSDTELFRNNELLNAFRANQARIPVEVFNLFTRELDDYLKGDTPTDKRAATKRFLNDCLKMPGWAKPDPREELLTNWVTLKPGETENQLQQRLRTAAEAQVKAAFKKGALVGKGIDVIEETILDYFIAELADRRRHELSEERQNGEPYQPKPYPPIVIDGPPGTGKTSIAEVIADALGMGFDINALAAESDINKITGRGSNWANPESGIITKAMLKQKVDKHGKVVRDRTNGNVVLLDECEKADPNLINSLGNYLETKGLASGFQDNYFCSSAVMKPGSTFFILATNYYDTLPEHIRSRVKKLNLSGYTLNDKCDIVKSIMKGTPVFKEQAAIFNDEDIKFFVKNYSDQPGARELSAMYGELSGKITAEKSNPNSPYKDKATGKIIVNQKFIIETLQKNFSRLTIEQQQIAELSINFDELKKVLSSKEEELKTAQQNSSTDIDKIKAEITQARQEVISSGVKLLSLYNTVVNPKYRDTRSIQLKYVEETQKLIGGLEESIFTQKTKLFETTNTKDVAFYTAKKALNKTQKRKVKKSLKAINARLQNVGSKSAEEANSLSLQQQKLEEELNILKIDSRTIKISRGIESGNLGGVRFRDHINKKTISGNVELMHQHIDDSISKYTSELSSQEGLEQGNKAQEIQEKIDELIALKDKLNNYTANKNPSSERQGASSQTQSASRSIPQKPGLWARIKNWIIKKLGGNQPYTQLKDSSQQNDTSINADVPNGTGITNMGPNGHKPTISSMDSQFAAQTKTIDSSGSSVTLGFSPIAALAERVKQGDKITMVGDEQFTTKDLNGLHARETAKTKELKTVIKEINAANNPEIIQQLLKIKTLFDEVNQIKQDLKQKGQQHSQAKTDKKAELQTAVSKLGELVKTHNIPSLTKIYNSLKEASKKTTQADNGYLKSFLHELNNLSMYQDLDVSMDHGSLQVKDASGKLIEVTNADNKLQITSSKQEPSNASLVRMAIYALDGTKSNKFNITNCQNPSGGPRAAIKLYLFSKVLGLTPTLDAKDGTKKAVEDFIASNPSDPSTQRLIGLYNQVKDTPAGTELPIKLLQELKQWEKEFYNEQDQKTITFQAKRS
jgi:hypothetical protein